MAVFGHRWWKPRSKKCGRKPKKFINAISSSQEVSSHVWLPSSLTWNVSWLRRIIASNNITPAAMSSVRLSTPFAVSSKRINECKFATYFPVHQHHGKFYLYLLPWLLKVGVSPAQVRQLIIFRTDPKQTEMEGAIGGHTSRMRYFRLSWFGLKLYHFFL